MEMNTGNVNRPMQGAIQDDLKTNGRPQEKADVEAQIDITDKFSPGGPFGPNPHHPHNPPPPPPPPPFHPPHHHK